MFDAFVDGLLMVLQWKAFLYMLIGSGVGSVSASCLV